MKNKSKQVGRRLASGIIEDHNKIKPLKHYMIVERVIDKRKNGIELSTTEENEYFKVISLGPRSQPGIKVNDQVWLPNLCGTELDGVGRVLMVNSFDATHTR